MKFHQVTTSSPAPCDYTKGKNTSRDQIISKTSSHDLLFEGLEKGFLSNRFKLYAPNCDNCARCVPIRTNTSKFVPNKLQKRVLQKSSLHFDIIDPSTTQDPSLLKLYYDYATKRHNHSWYTIDSTFDRMISSCDLIIAAYTKENALVGFITLIEHGSSLAAERIIYDLNLKHKSIGTQLWLKAVSHAKNNDIDHIYPGQWIKDNDGEHTKMDYKKNLGGLETVVNGEWVDFDPRVHTEFTEYPKMIADLKSKPWPT